MNIDQKIMEDFASQLKERMKIIEENEPTNPQENEAYNCLCKVMNKGDLIESEEGLVCSNCGVILERILSEVEENKTDGEGLKIGLSRYSGFASDSLMSGINNSGTTVRGSKKMERMMLWMSMTYEDQVLIELKKKLTNIVILNEIPSRVVRLTLILFKKLFNSKKVNGAKEIYRGAIKIGLVSVCFFYACKHTEYTLLISRVVEIFKIDQNLFNKCCKIYSQSVDLNLDKKTFSYRELIRRYCRTLKYNDTVSRLVNNIFESTLDLGLFDNCNPQSVICGTLVFVTKELNLGGKEKLIELHETCNTSSSTSTKVLKGLLEHKLEIFNHIKNLQEESQQI